MSRTIFPSLSESERVETWLVRPANESDCTMTDFPSVTCLLQKNVAREWLMKTRAVTVRFQPRWITCEPEGFKLEPVELSPIQFCASPFFFGSDDDPSFLLLPSRMLCDALAAHSISMNSTPTNTARTELHSTANHISSREHAWLKITIPPEKFERFRRFWCCLADSNSIFVAAEFFFDRFEFWVCSKFNHTQCGRTCACAVACLCDRIPIRMLLCP